VNTNQIINYYFLFFHIYLVFCCAKFFSKISTISGQLMSSNNFQELCLSLNPAHFRQYCTPSWIYDFNYLLSFERFQFFFHFFSLLFFTPLTFQKCKKLNLNLFREQFLCKLSFVLFEVGGCLLCSCCWVVSFVRISCMLVLTRKN
jgi:hypothetical protein